MKTTCPASCDLQDRPSQGTTRKAITYQLLYSLAYLGFILLSVFRPEWMGNRALFGLNLAVTYGMALILLAIGMAIMYNRSCENANQRRDTSK